MAKPVTKATSISRTAATTISVAFCEESVIVPGPFSDQAVNAEYLASRGAAVHLPGARIDELEALVLALLDDAERRRAMAEAMRALAKPDAAAHIAAIVRRAAGAEEAAA